MKKQVRKWTCILPEKYKEKSKEVNQSRMDKTNMGMDFEETEVVTKGGSPKQNLEAGMHNLSVNEENNLDGTGQEMIGEVIRELLGSAKVALGAERELWEYNVNEINFGHLIQVY